jgi:hypothetical protein
MDIAALLAMSVLAAKATAALSEFSAFAKLVIVTGPLAARYAKMASGLTGCVPVALLGFVALVFPETVALVLAGALAVRTPATVSLLFSAAGVVLLPVVLLAGRLERISSPTIA